MRHTKDIHKHAVEEDEEKVGIRIVRIITRYYAIFLYENFLYTTADKTRT